MKLTWKEAYRAAYGFLDGIWDGVTGEDQELLSELDTFLSGMMPQEDETSADPGMMDLWHEAVAQITHGGGWGDLTAEEAYQAMVLFLELWAGDNSDGTISGICQDLSRIGIGTIGNMVGVGYIADFAMRIISAHLPEGGLTMAVRVVLFALSMVIFLIAASFYMVVDLGVSPYDALPQLIAARVKRLNFRTVRMIWDISFLSAGFLLGSTVGVTTVITGFFLGPAIVFVSDHVKSWFAERE